MTLLACKKCKAYDDRKRKCKVTGQPRGPWDGQCERGKAEYQSQINRSLEAAAGGH